MIKEGLDQMNNKEKIELANKGAKKVLKGIKQIKKLFASLIIILIIKK